eukprot:3822940-Prymnesium_polylepis.1
MQQVQQGQMAELHQMQLAQQQLLQRQQAQQAAIMQTLAQQQKKPRQDVPPLAGVLAPTAVGVAVLPDVHVKSAPLDS